MQFIIMINKIAFQSKANHLWMCGHLHSCDKDGGHTIQSNPMHANFTSRCIL